MISPYIFHLSMDVLHVLQAKLLMFGMDKISTSIRHFNLMLFKTFSIHLFPNFVGKHKGI